MANMIMIRSLAPAMRHMARAAKRTNGVELALVGGLSAHEGQAGKQHQQRREDAHEAEEVREAVHTRRRRGGGPRRPDRGPSKTSRAASTGHPPRRPRARARRRGSRRAPGWAARNAGLDIRVDQQGPPARPGGARRSPRPPGAGRAPEWRCRRISRRSPADHEDQLRGEVDEYRVEVGHGSPSSVWLGKPPG